MKRQKHVTGIIYRERNKKRSEAKYGAVSGEPKEHLAAYCTAARVVVQ